MNLVKNPGRYLIKENFRVGVKTLCKPQDLFQKSFKMVIFVKEILGVVVNFNPSWQLLPRFLCDHHISRDERDESLN